MAVFRPPFSLKNLIVQNYIEQRAVNLQGAFGPTGVVDEAQLPEPVHEKADPRTSGSDHLGESLLTDFGDNGFGNAFLAEMSQQ